MSATLWDKCLSCLQDEFPLQQFNTWIRPLQVEHTDSKLTLYAPNRFVLDWINDRFLSRIKELVNQFSQDTPPPIYLAVGSCGTGTKTDTGTTTGTSTGGAKTVPAATHSPAATAFAKPANTATELPNYKSNINLNFTFDNFVEGKSNQLAKAASLQVGENPGVAYNPLYLYGGVGLGNSRSH